MHTTQKPKDTKATGAAPSTPKADDKKMDDRNQASKPSDRDAKSRFSKK
jgi:hypothetical protein